MVKKWQILSRENIFKKYSRAIDEVVVEHPNGKKADYYVKDEGSAVAILAITEDKKVILARQYRIGPDEILNELPGGGIDKDETPLEAAQRELLEETGYTGAIEYAGECYDDAYSTMRRYAFVATQCKKVAEPSLDEYEDIDIILMDINDFYEELGKGAMTDIEIGYMGLRKLHLLSLKS